MNYLFLALLAMAMAMPLAMLMMIMSQGEIAIEVRTAKRQGVPGRRVGGGTRNELPPVEKTVS